MNGIHEIVSNFKSVFAESDYPEELLSSYDQMECMSSHVGREVFLVRRKKTGELAVARCYDRSSFQVKSGMIPAGAAQIPGIPRYLERFENEKTVCVLYEYIQGESLDQYFRANPPTLDGILDIAKKLCDILARLHAQEPPIIHLDIKPENIIIQPDGKVFLIDFDASRVCVNSNGDDSFTFGTRGFAPPEQYGFSRTDCRSDIFAFGILLRWMVTGSIRQNDNVTIHPDLKRIIDRCSAYDPEARYQSIAAVRKDLDSVRRRRPPLSFAKAAILGAIILVLALCGGFALGRYTNILTPVESVSFVEPLIEKAVRLQLGRDAGALTPEDLLQVRNLYIWGDEAFASLEDYSSQHFEGRKTGSLRVLDDLSRIPNLEEVWISCQEYLDVQGIAGLSALRTVEFKHTQILSIEPIANLHQLKHICLFDAGVSDVSALQACPWLETLDIGLNPIGTTAKIGRYPSLQYLNLMWIEMNDIDDIAERIPRLKAVSLQYGNIRDMSGLTKLGELETVYVLEEQRESVAGILSGKDMEIVVQE